MTVKFSETGNGLVTKHTDTLRGFSLAGEDGKWHHANANIEGNTVIVSCEAVPEPKNVRFAYAHNRQWANLFNKDGLPALAFTTE